MAILPKLKHLEKLDLRSTQVSDAGLKEIAQLKYLSMLDVRNLVGFERATDAGLMQLATLRHLSYLDIAGLESNKNSFSDRAISDLEHALPGCRIVRE